MRVSLPSGGWAEIRENLTAEDRWAVQEAIVFEIATDAAGQVNPMQRVSSATTERARQALLARVITSWSLADQGIPVPSQNAAGADVLGSLDLDDWDALAEAVQPLVDKANPGSGRPNRKKKSAA